jgi:hypothetical protein
VAALVGSPAAPVMSHATQVKLAWTIPSTFAGSNASLTTPITQYVVTYWQSLIAPRAMVVKTNSAVITGLTPGEWFFEVRAYLSPSVASANSAPPFALVL